MNPKLPPSSASARRIFVVDDEDIIASTLTTILKRNGYLATSFNRANDALDQARVQPPDLVISDVVMPGMSGIDLAIRLNQLHPETGVLLFSGQAATEDLLKRARANGHAFNILPKPIHPVELLRVVAEHLPSQTPAT